MSQETHFYKHNPNSIKKFWIKLYFVYKKVHFNFIFQTDHSFIFTTAGDAMGISCLTNVGLMCWNFQPAKKTKAEKIPSSFINWVDAVYEKVPTHDQLTNFRHEDSLVLASYESSLQQKIYRNFCPYFHSFFAEWKTRKPDRFLSANTKWDFFPDPCACMSKVTTNSFSRSCSSGCHRRDSFFEQSQWYFYIEWLCGGMLQKFNVQDSFCVQKFSRFCVLFGKPK